jgi:2-desacetyl-2-hydroxyethyl bacteriochlorophyllide A dehydrogenase
MHQAIVFTGVDTPTLQTVTLPALAADEVLIETAYSCVSPGTELRCLAGQQDGLKFPFIPGYSLSGIVVQTGAAVTSIAVGMPVFCTGTMRADLLLAWGGHVSHAIQKAGNVYPLPAGVDLLDAAVTHIAGISYHGMRLSQPMAHETVVVVGLGIIGQFSARLHALSGARVLGVDLAPERVRLLRDVGIDAVTSLGEARALLPDGADIVVDASGVSSLIAQAVDLARALPWDDTPTPNARYLIQGSYAGDFAVPYQAAFMKQLTFMIPRDAQPRDFRTVLDLLSRRKLSVRDLLSEVASPADAPRIYRALRNRDLLTAVFAWRG